MKKQLNKRKHRNDYIPIAASCLEDQGYRFFQNFCKCPYGERTFKATDLAKALIPAAVHMDGSVRVHSVCQEHDALFYGLLRAFFELTQIPVLLNTSLNRHNEPIVSTPADALCSLIDGLADVLAMGSYLVSKTGDHNVLMADV